MAQSSNPSSTGAGIYRRLLNYSFAQWQLLSIAIAGMFISALTEPAFAALMRPMLDGSFVERDPTALKWVPIFMLLIFIARGVSNFFSTYYMERVGRTVIKTIRNEVFSKYLALPTSSFDKTAKGDLIARVTFNTEQVANAATKSLTILIRDTITVIGLLAWMFYLSWELSLGILIVAPLVSLIVAFVTKRFRKISKSIQSSMGGVTHVTEEAIDGQRVVKVFGGQDYEQARFEKVNAKNTELHVKLAKVKAATTPVVQFLVALVLAGIVAFATQESFQDQITVGTFMSFMTAMMMLLTPIRRLTNVNVMIQKGIAAGEDIFALLDAPEERDEGTQVVDKKVSGRLEFKGVGFRYNEDSDAVLKDINLSVNPGQTVALVGRSGSGKTTLVNLLPRLYERTEGQITLDGIDIDDIPLRGLRDQLAYVGQQVTLFSGSVRNNIAYGRLDSATEEDIIAAAKAAHAWEFIERLPQGLDTEVGEDGVLLSGGQRQRLAIARALLKDAPVLILDEATAALDTESERHIQAALDEVCRGRTTLVIAHRLSTVENADCIVVMQSGAIVESGKHHELLAEDGIYAMLHNMQFSEN